MPIYRYCTAAAARRHLFSKAEKEKLVWPPKQLGTTTGHITFRGSPAQPTHVQTAERGVVRKNPAVRSAEPWFLRITTKLDTYFELSPAARSKSLTTLQGLLCSLLENFMLRLLEIMSWKALLRQKGVITHPARREFCQRLPKRRACGALEGIGKQNRSGRTGVLHRRTTQLEERPISAAMSKWTRSGDAAYAGRPQHSQERKCSAPSQNKAPSGAGEGKQTQQEQNKRRNLKIPLCDQLGTCCHLRMKQPSHLECNALHTSVLSLQKATSTGRLTASTLSFEGFSSCLVF